ncbi:hypothetical protein [Psychrobacillus psychrotolerans]|uniref:hypothetical protein n=1 Tax=Psychrobacillus psychrotolerans TaxID=126156 RepID=UPI000B81FAAC|nr:hypothetical protein [Psychrobacillus psychrotolerans]
MNTLLELFRRQGPPRRLQWEKLELKTPQERSDEEAEAKPTESEVVGLAEFNIQLYTPKVEFVYSLKANHIWLAFSFTLVA